MVLILMNQSIGVIDEETFIVQTMHVKSGRRKKGKNVLQSIAGIKLKTGRQRGLGVIVIRQSAQVQQ